MTPVMLFFIGVEKSLVTTGLYISKKLCDIMGTVKKFKKLYLI